MVPILEQDVRAVVRGAVVQHDEFEIGVCLRQHGVDALTDIFTVVVVGNDDRDRGGGFVVVPLYDPEILLFDGSLFAGPLVDPIEKFQPVRIGELVRGAPTDLVSDILFDGFCAVMTDVEPLK